MFLHKHPYQPFIPKNATRLIVGTLPPPRFSTGQLLEHDVDFCYGSCHMSLWRYIDKIHGLDLAYENSEEAITQRKEFLKNHNIGIYDIIESAERKKIDASDLGMQNIKLRDVLNYIKQYPKIHTLLFIGGNSKNGPEYLFRRHLKSYDLKLKLVSGNTPKIHEFNIENRSIKTVSLTSSSGAANISIGSTALYKQLKAKNPNFNTFGYRVMQYKAFI